MRGVAIEELGGEQGDVLAPLAQRRDADLDGVEAVEQVLAKAPGGHLGGEVGIGGGEDAHLDLPGAR